MAYRQLCAVTFAVLGWVTVGCGSGSGSLAATDVTDDQPPANPDRPSNNASDRVSNPDQAPANRDQPPSDADGLPSSGSGGGAEAACQAFCASVQGKDCKGGLGGVIQLICSSGCVLSAQDQACAGEIGAAIACLSGLQALCTDAFDENQAKTCQSAFDAADACDEAHQPPDDNNNGGSCTKTGGCECGGSACATCTCEAGDDTAALAACVTGACAQ